jgi:hypothetical protein
LVAAARTLHDVKVVVHEEHLRRSGGILFVNFDERIDAVLIIWLRQIQLK